MSLRCTSCFLCGTEGAEVGPAIVPGSSPRTNRMAVACPECRGYLIATSLARAGSISPDVGRTLSALARKQYQDDGSSILEVTENMVHSPDEPKVA